MQLEQVARSRVEALKQDVAEAVPTVTELFALVKTLEARLAAVEGQVGKSVPTLTRTLEDVDLKRKEVDTSVQRSVSSDYAMLHSIVSAARGAVSVFSDILSPIQEALLNAMWTAVDVGIAIATAQYSNPYTFWIGVVMTAASTTLSIMGAIAIEQGMTTAHTELGNAQGMLNLVSGMVGGYHA